MKTLIFGQNGQLACEFKKLLTGADVYQLGNDQVDFTNPAKVAQTIAEVKPEIIINCAAYTAVDKAEAEKEKALQVNGVILGVIGESAKKINCGVIHYSTDYVFNGKKKTPYSENDEVDPINYYGRSKLIGEENLLNSGARAFVFRVSWVYGIYGANFLKTIVRLAQERTELKIVGDQLGGPTASADIAKATVKIMDDPQFIQKSGLYHMAPQGEGTWYDFATEIVRLARLNPRFEVKTELVLPITSDQFPSPAKRPENSRLSAQKLQDVFQISLPDWRESLRRVFEQVH